MKLGNKSCVPHSSSAVPGLPLTPTFTFHVSRFTFPSALLGLLVASLLLVLPGRLLAAGEERFSSPQAAVDVLKAAVEARDTNALHVIFGPAGHSLVSVDVVEAAAERELFMRRVKEKVNLVAESDSKEVLQLGADGWPFPIPLVKTRRAVVLRFRSRQRGNPQPAHWSKRAGRHSGLPRLRAGPARICQRGSQRG